MPLFYAWLLLVSGAVMAADCFKYKYKWWFAQGTAMAFIVMMSMLAFKCGSSASRTDRKSGSDLSAQPGSTDQFRKVMVTRDGI